MINSSLARRDSDCDLLKLDYSSFDRSYRARGLTPSGIFIIASRLELVSLLEVVIGEVIIS